MRKFGGVRREQGHETQAVDRIQKAAALFNRKGYEEPLFSDLMEARIAKGGIYRHFDSKEDCGRSLYYAWQTRCDFRQG